MEIDSLKARILELEMQIEEKEKKSGKKSINNDVDDAIVDPHSLSTRRSTCT